MVMVEQTQPHTLWRLLSHITHSQLNIDTIYTYAVMQGFIHRHVIM